MKLINTEEISLTASLLDVACRPISKRWDFTLSEAWSLMLVLKETVCPSECLSWEEQQRLQTRPGDRRPIT